MKNLVRFFSLSFAFVVGSAFWGGEAAAQTQKIAMRSHAGERVEWSGANNFGLPSNLEDKYREEAKKKTKADKALRDGKRVDSLAQAHWQRIKTSPAVVDSTSTKKQTAPKTPSPKTK